jgi:excisionase family DNA binding protein
MSLPTKQYDSNGENRRPPAELLTSSLIDIRGVSQVLSVTPRHIQRLVAERRIPYLKVGRFVRFDPAELSVWLDQQRREVRSPVRHVAPRR